MYIKINSPDRNLGDGFMIYSSTKRKRKKRNFFFFYYFYLSIITKNAAVNRSIRHARCYGVFALWGEGIWENLRTRLWALFFFLCEVFFSLFSISFFRLVCEQEKNKEWGDARSSWIRIWRPPSLLSGDATSVLFWRSARSRSTIMAKVQR